MTTEVTYQLYLEEVALAPAWWANPTVFGLHPVLYTN